LGTNENERSRVDILWVRVPSPRWAGTMSARGNNLHAYQRFESSARRRCTLKTDRAS